MQAECLGDFFQNLGNKDLMYQKRWQKNVLTNPGGAFDLTTKIATSAFPKIPNRLYQFYQS